MYVITQFCWNLIHFCSRYMIHLSLLAQTGQSFIHATIYFYMSAHDSYETDIHWLQCDPTLQGRRDRGARAWLRHCFDQSWRKRRVRRVQRYEGCEKPRGHRVQAGHRGGHDLQDWAPFYFWRQFCVQIRRWGEANASCGLIVETLGLWIWNCSNILRPLILWRSWTPFLFSVLQFTIGWS